MYGEAIYSVGGNYEASRLSGMRVRAVVASTYIVLGGCIGLAGCIIASQLTSAKADPHPGIIFDVLTIVVVGGTSLSGGTGAMWRTAVGLRNSLPPSPTASCCSTSVLTTSRSSRARSSSQRSRSTAV